MQFTSTTCTANAQEQTNKEDLIKKKKKLFFASIDQKLDTFSFNVYQGSPEERFNLSI